MNRVYIPLAKKLPNKAPHRQTGRLAQPLQEGNGSVSHLAPES